jgi:hypothetical protein
MEKYDILAI